MSRATFRHILTALAVLAIGPIAGAIAGDTRLPGGVRGATPMTGEFPLRSALLMLIALAIVGATGTLAARLYGARQGLLSAGLVAVWVASRQGTVERSLTSARSAGPLTLLMIEGILIGAIALMIVWIILRVSRGSHGSPGGPGTERASFVIGASTFGFAASLAAVGAVCGAYLIGVEAMKGQVLFAAFAGSVLAGAASRFVRHDVGLSGPAALGTFAGVAFVGVLGPVWASVCLGDGVVAAAFAGSLPRVSGIGPSDWLAGALLGVPVGDAWASAMFQSAAPEAA